MAFKVSTIYDGPIVPLSLTTYRLPREQLLNILSDGKWHNIISPTNCDWATVCQVLNISAVSLCLTGKAQH